MVRVRPVFSFGNDNDIFQNLVDGHLKIGANNVTPTSMGKQ